MVTTRSMDDVPACVAIDAAMDRFPCLPECVSHGL